MLSNFLIGLREGLEAALVVGIIVAYLVRTDKRDWLPAVWVGVAIAVAASLGVGAVLTFTSRELSFKAQEAFGGFMSIFAVGLVTWMVFWMRAEARNLKGELQGKVDVAMRGGMATMAFMAFISVGREGLETALFLWPALRAAGAGAAPAVGASLGLLIAVVIGWLLYRRSVSLNLAAFFKATGAALIVDRRRRAGLRRPRPPGGGHRRRPRQHRVRRHRADPAVELVRHPAQGDLQLPGRTDGAAGRRLPRVPGAHAGPVLPSDAGTRRVARTTESGSRPMIRRVLLLSLLACAGLSACAESAKDAVLVTATDSACEPAETEFKAGKITFEVKNEGDDVTELYVYGEGDKVISEVENVGPGTSRTLSVDIKAGEYELACKPGQTGAGIRAPITVTGSGGSQGGDAVKADREVPVHAVEYEFKFDAPPAVKVGEAIEFELINDGKESHEFELFGPDGKVLGEIEETGAGKTDEAVFEFEKAGTYKYECHVADHHERGMHGELTVA